MRTPSLAVVVLLVAGCPQRPSPADSGTSSTAGNALAVHPDARVHPPVPAAVPPSAPASAGRPPVLAVRVKNVGTTPLRILTNPDANEMIRAYRVNVTPDTSDRAAMFADGTRVMAFPIGQMALCTADAGVGSGYGGLGQPGQIVLAPGESFEAARWDGILREEVNDPVRGMCAREFPPTVGRYRFQLDQPELEGRPQCNRVMFPYPVVSDGGMPVVELRCHNPPRDGGTQG